LFFKFDVVILRVFGFHAVEFWGHHRLGRTGFLDPSFRYAFESDVVARFGFDLE